MATKETGCKEKFLKPDELKKDGLTLKFEQNRTLKCWVYLVVFLNILLMLLLLSLIVSWKIIREDFLTSKESTMCIPCSNLGVDDTKELPERWKGVLSRQVDTSMNATCCGEANAVLNELIAQGIQERWDMYRPVYNELTTSACKHDAKMLSSAQVNGLSSTYSEAEDGTILWKMSESSSTKGAIEYKNGRFKVMEPGFYYVFYQVKYNHTEDAGKLSDAGVIDTVFHQMIYRYNSKTDETIKVLENAKSVCEHISAGDLTSAAGSVHYLDENDEVFVKTSHPNNLAPGDGSNYFGLYLTQ